MFRVVSAVCIIFVILIAHVSAISCANSQTYYTQAGLSTVYSDTCFAQNPNTTSQIANLCSSCQTQLKSFRTKLNNDQNCAALVPIFDAPMWFDTKNSKYCGVVTVSKVNLSTSANLTTFYDLYYKYTFIAGASYAAFLNGSAAPMFDANSAMLNGSTIVTCASASYCYVLALKNMYYLMYGNASANSVAGAFGNAMTTCGIASTDLSNTCSLGQFSSNPATHLKIEMFAVWFVLLAILGAASF
jgi:hypothetical protein